MKGLFIFAAGLAIGAVAGACVIKNKVLADAKAEIEEVREYYRSARGKKEVEETIEINNEKNEVESREDYKPTKKEYTDYTKLASSYNSEDRPIKDILNSIPAVIDPSEFGEEPGYDTMTLTYFADGVLVDDVDDVIEEPDLVVGLENLKIFEEFGASTVYVRNDIYKTDYEIIKDDWNYSDIQDSPIVNEKKPHQL